MVKILDECNAPDYVKNGAILVVKSGSHAYGTATPDSDRDYRGICFAPLETYFGNATKFEQLECKSPDVVIYELRKFVKLATQCNPNIIEILFTEDEDRVVCTHEASTLLKMRDLFLTKRAKSTFSGYAVSQLKKLSVTGDDALLAPKNLAGVAEASKRAKRQAKFGYDTKNAMHLVRLLRMCYEILCTGIVQVKRPDADELLAIRNGAWTLKEIREYTEHMDAMIAEAAEYCWLPEHPDEKKIDSFLVQMLKDRFMPRSENRIKWDGYYANVNRDRGR